MKKRRILTLFLLAALTFLFIGCSGKSAGVLEVEKTYIGASTTSEIIEVDESDKWTIKDKYEDDTNYIIARISETGEKIGDYPVFKVVAEEIYGEDSVFAKREGENYIVTEDDEKVYFTRIRESNKDEIVKGIEEAKDVDEYVKEKAKFKFEK